LYFDDVREHVSIREGTFIVAWVSVPLPHRQQTNDPDEVTRVLSSGAVAFVDPTGDDGQGYDDVRVVSIVQPDGSIGFVMGFKGTSLESTVAVADKLDRALREHG
jgi:hypothetical protein